MLVFMVFFINLEIIRKQCYEIVHDWFCPIFYAHAPSSPSYSNFNEGRLIVTVFLFEEVIIRNVYGILLLIGSTAQLRPWPPPHSSSIKNARISWRLLNNFFTG
jgi:hypothetical protein